MAQLSSERIEIVGRGIKRWQNVLVDTAGHNHLLRYRDLETSTLDLTPGQAYGLDARAMDRLLAGRPVSLSDIFSTAPDGSYDFTAFEDARRRLTAIHKTAVKDLEENGIETLMAAIGLTTWQVDSGAPPNAPVILLPLDVEATGAVARDFRIEVAGDAHLAPVLSQILRVDHGMDAGPWVVFYHRRLARRLETPSFVLT